MVPSHVPWDYSLLGSSIRKTWFIASVKGRWWSQNTGHILDRGQLKVFDRRTHGNLLETCPEPLQMTKMSARHSCELRLRLGNEQVLHRLNDVVGESYLRHYSLLSLSIHQRSFLLGEAQRLVVTQTYLHR